MTNIVCPLCRTRVISHKSNTDILHQCQASDTWEQEDIIHLGSFENDQVHGGASGPAPGWNWQGNANKVWGTNSHADNPNLRVPNRTSRGNNADTRRQIPRILHFDLTNQRSVMN